MRRGWKIFWIVCGVMAVIGFICCAIAWGMGVTTSMLHNRFPNGIGWSWDYYDDYYDDDHDAGPRAEDIHESFTGVSEIDMDLFAGQVSILEDDGDTVRVETHNLSQKLGFKCRMDGNELKLTSKKRLYRVNNAGRGTITVYIPREMNFDEASLSMGAGKLNIENIYARELSVEVGAGEVTVDGFCADEADFECGAGTITARGEIRNSADLQCGVGNIVYTASGREEEYNYDIECGIGEVICGSSTYSGLGKNQHIDNDADKDINIEGGVGSVIIDFDRSGSYHQETETHHEEHE